MGHLKTCLHHLQAKYFYSSSCGCSQLSCAHGFPHRLGVKPAWFPTGTFLAIHCTFIFGFIAYKNNWLNTLSFKAGKRMLALVIVLILFFPVFYVIKLKLDMPLDWFSGGWHWQSLLYAVWEQVLGFSIITMLLSYGKALWNMSSVILGKLSRYTFAVYIFHPLVLISLSLVVRNWAIDPAAKLLVVGPLAVVGSFLLASVIVAIPGVKKVI